MNRRIQFAVAAALAAASGATHAQQAATEAPAGLDEIVVTAQRKVERLQDVPVAVSAIGREALEAASISGAQELAMRVPSLSMTAFNIAQPRIFIRGIGSTDDGAAQDNSVAVFVDDVYVARGSGQAFEFLDIERVEVLRGPQGTLYGKNVVGGVVNVISRRPQREFESRVSASYGNYDAIDLRGYVTGAMGANGAGSLSALVKDRSGYAENVRLGRDLEDQQSWALRGQYLWQPSDAVDVLFAADYNDHSDNGQSRKGEGPYTTPPFGSVTAAQTTRDPRKSESPRVTFQDRQVWGALGRVDWRVGPGTLTSISAFRSSDVDLADAFTGIGSPPYRVLDTANIEKEKAEQFSQEVRYGFDGLAGDRVSGVVGLYYLNETVDRTEIADLVSVIGSQLPTVLGGLTGISGSYQDADNTSMGAFASMTWKFTDAWSFTVGGRYTREEKDIRTQVRRIADTDAILAAPPTETYDVSASDTWSKFTPRAALQWKPADNLMLYASYATGFKSGGFQGQAPTAAAARSPFDPEEATSVELGLKSTLLDRRLTLNVAVFDTDYEDLQVRQNAQRPGEPLPILRITNAGAAQAKGFEVELQARPVESLQVWATYGYLDSEYVKLVDNTGVSRAGNPLQFAPKNTYNLGTELTLPVGAEREFFARVEYSRQGEFWFDPAANAVNYQGSYALVDASLGLKLGDGKSIELWGKNLNDTLYRTHVIPFLGDRFAVYGPPRTYGVRVRWGFN
jgi:iron complex outermembrane receptor protein